MKKKFILDVFSISLVISGILLITWWILLGISQVFSNSGDSLSQLVQSSTWIPINIIGLIAALFLVIGLMRILFEEESSLGLLGVIISIFGVVLFTAVQFEETFVWPLLARYSDNLLEINGPMFTNLSWLSIYIIMGVLFALGFIIIAIHSLRRNIFPKTPSILMIIGAPIFGSGIYLPIMIRTIGLIFLSISFIWIGFFKLKN